LTSDGSPIVGALVSFTALGSPLCQSQTDADGSATCSVDTDPDTGLSLATTGYAATFVGDTTHLPASGHSPMFGDNHWRGRHGHSERTWRRPPGSDSSPGSGTTASSPGSWQSPASPTQAGATTLPPTAVSVIDDPTSAKKSGSGYVVGLLALAGLMLVATMLGRRRKLGVHPARPRGHGRAPTGDSA